MKEKILKLCEELCCETLTPEEQLITTGLLNSYKIIELICSLEDGFHITFLPEEITKLDNFSCVDHIFGIVKDKIDHGPNNG